MFFGEKIGEILKNNDLTDFTNIILASHLLQHLTLTFGGFIKGMAVSLKVFLEESGVLNR